MHTYSQRGRQARQTKRPITDKQDRQASKRARPEGRRKEERKEGTTKGSKGRT
jgi:hypothetical protein